MGNIVEAGGFGDTRAPSDDEDDYDPGYIRPSLDPSMVTYRDGVNYVKDGKVMEHYPSNIYQYDGVSVEYITMPGWKTSISNIRKFEDLPANAQNYITKVEELLGVPFRWVGVGPERDSMILRN